jgi:hypothetical protein
MRLLMFKTLVLNTVYTLSGNQIKYQLRERLLFIRFFGLDLVGRCRMI